MVGLVPQFKLYAYLCDNILYDNFFSKKLTFTEIINKEAMKLYYKSIGWEENYDQNFLRVQLTIESADNFRAIVGSGHFVATYRSENFVNPPPYEIRELIGPKSDRDFLDYPLLKKGGWRLTTENNFAYHMGNVYESWIEDELHKLKPSSNNVDLHLKKLKSNKASYFIKNHLFRKLLQNKNFIHWFIKFKGLPRDMAKTRWHV